MNKDIKFLVRVDQYGNWTEDKYREVTRDELDAILIKFSRQLMDLVSGKNGAMAMWACFKNVTSAVSGCGGYSDAINAYRMLTDDHKSLEDREHELRHFWKKYEELKQIRHYGSVENYYLKKAEDAKNRQVRILENQGGNVK